MGVSSFSDRTPASLGAILDGLRLNFGHECDFSIETYKNGYVIKAKRRVAIMGKENYWQETWLAELMGDPQYSDAILRNFLERLRYDGIR